MNPLLFSLERGILIAASRETVFSFFTRSDLFARWWGTGSHIDGKPGGAYLIRYPNGVLATGKILEMDAPQRVVLTYGYEDPSKPIAPGGSLVTITLESRPTGTWLHLRHDVDTEKNRDDHANGWNYQLALFSNAAAREQAGDANALLDRYFAAWAETDAAARTRQLEGVVEKDVVFRDPYGSTTGVEELVALIRNIHMFMPGVLPRRSGDVRLCHGSALVNWTASAADGTVKAKGTNALDLSPAGKLSRITGFWDA